MGGVSCGSPALLSSARQDSDVAFPAPIPLFLSQRELLTINGAAFTGSISPRSPDRSSVLLWSLSLSVE